MTSAEFISKVQAHGELLAGFVSQYHPATPDGPRRNIGPITASTAETACENGERYALDTATNAAAAVQRRYQQMPERSP